MNILKGMISVLDFLFPPRCVGCGRVGMYICGNCQRTIQVRQPLCPECDRPAVDGLTHPRCRRPWGVDGLITVFTYAGVIKKAIKAIKYRFVSDMAESLVRLVPSSIYQSLQFFPSESVLYPIPLHEDRLRWRGFNQAEKLGTILAQKLRIKTVDELLVRKTKRTPQADISHRDERIKNAQGLFQLANDKLPTQVLLFDDVWTTGATMKEATKVLKRSGVEKAWAVTLAR